MNIIIEITRELNKESLLNCYSIYINYRWSMLSIINLTLKFMYCLYFTLISFIRTLCHIYVPWCYPSHLFYPTLAKSRLMTSHHVICHVTSVTCLFIVKKKKEDWKKRNIKSRKIDKRKRKMLVFKCTITSTLYWQFIFFKDYIL